MKIRVYPANENDHDCIYQELDFDAVPRVGDFVCVPFEVERAWAREALISKCTCECFTQWMYRGHSVAPRLDFSDASYVTKVFWIYDQALKKMVCCMRLDVDDKEEYSINRTETFDLSAEEFGLIKKGTSEWYELEEI